MLKVAFHTLGCKVNQYETEAMQKLFFAAGYEISNEIETADIVVVNTCTVTALSSQKSRQMIRKFSRANKNAVLAVVGCYAQKEPEKISEIDGVDIIIGTSDRMKIVELVEKVLKNRKEKIFFVNDVENISEFEELPHTPQRTRAFLKIEDGCNNFCSYCIIPFVRGRVRSRSLESIRAECRELKKNNFKEIVLTGIHIGAYGRDFKNKISLVDAVKIVLETAEPARLRLGSLESAEMTDELIDLMKNDSRICNHVHLPLQSGSDEILKAMHRPYMTKNFSDLTSRLVKEIPEISIGTDLIVGFPGETEKHFEETLNFLNSQPFSKIHVFPYSLREGTLAAEMKNQIDSQTKKIRAAKVLEIANTKEKIFAEKIIGQTVEIIAETEENGLIDGLTKNYIRGYVPADEKIKLGEFIRVKAEKIFKNGIRGEFLS
ncbi:MAG: tRNA (N(6)-L-threonylcarbamoyladenosine(37)-C(2))-methylthiotransferase MtaB [Selenomonadaceae bacterium]|nr:tRNA (N(6)-L-threonylcarbamoyladenosine(37)-C(2))-methylthiotransferase MtaB [Selenomonadaceae bacterium]